MTEIEVYEKFIEWLKTAPSVFPDSEDMTELIKARYTPDDAALLTNIPFNGRTIKELVEIKGMPVEELKPSWMPWPKKAWSGRSSPMGPTVTGFVIRSWCFTDPCIGAEGAIPSITKWRLC